MEQIANAIRDIGAASGSNDKKRLLLRYSNVPGLKDVLKFIYNPYIKTNISNAKLDRAMLRTDAQDCTLGLVELLDYYICHQTGTDFDCAFGAVFIKAMPKDIQWLGKAIVTQKLTIGVTSTTLNAVYGSDFILKIGCMLGTLYSDVRPETVQWPCIATEKLDGIRRLLIKKNKKVSLYSRSGHIDIGLADIENEARYLPDNYVYDGELLAIGDFKDSIALRQATASIANSNGTRGGLSFNVFDMIPLDEYNNGKSKQSALHRKVLLGATLGDESIQYLNDDWARLIVAYQIEKELLYIKPVPILGLLQNPTQLSEVVGPIWQEGGEGIMLNTKEGLYEIKRSKSLLKIKHTEEKVLKIVDMLEGTGKYENMMGSLIVDYNGSNVGVGTGFTDAERKMFWENYSAYIGVEVEIETFGESTSNGGISLNCPVFKRIMGGN